MSPVDTSNLRGELEPRRELPSRETTEERKRPAELTVEVEATGSVVETACGIGTIVLAIVGLALTERCRFSLPALRRSSWARSDLRWVRCGSGL